MASERSPYAEKLRVALDCDGWSLNKLARELAARTGNAVETERSAIRGYLKNSTPRPERAQLIADIMEMPELAVVENQSGRARVEARLEEGLERAAEILDNQKDALATQKQILAQLKVLAEGQQALRESLESPPVRGRSAPSRSRRQG